VVLAALLALLIQPPLAFVGATTYTGEPGVKIADSVVVVRDGKIAAVGPRAATPVPDDCRRVDAAGKFLTPGLVDAHVHYSQTGWADGRPDARDVRAAHPYERAMAENAAHPEVYHLAFLHSGVTAVFDVGGYPWTRLLGAATERSPRAPHVAAAGALLATYDPKVLVLPDQSQFVFPKDADEARRSVRSHHAFGSAAIKVWLIETQEHPADEWAPIVAAAGDEAEKAGLPLIVHATTLATARIAVAAGARLLVHSVENAEVDDDFVAAAKAAGTYYCPTLTVRAGYQQLYAAQLSDEVRAQLDSVHPSVKARVLATEDEQAKSKVNPRALEGMQKRIELQRKVMATNLLKLHAAGIKVAMGTDAGNPLTLHGPSAFVEMEAMQAAGMSASDVLVAATRNAAAAMGRGHDLGRVAAGCSADLLVLAEDPGKEARAFRSLVQVCRGGHLHERRDLLPR
jgi:imidazolonepropionase-like amidohydrolase